MRLASGAILRVAAVVAALLVVSGVAALPARAAQTIPYTINFQGRLTDNNGNALANGSYNVKFRIWNALTSGSNVWEEDRVYGASDNRVTVTNGLFNIQFGSLTTLSPSLFNSSSPLYLEVELPTPATATCASNGCASFTEGAMSPRQPFASSPYAFNADTIDGIDGSSLVQLSPGSQQTGSINVSSTIQTAGSLQITGTGVNTFSGNISVVNNTNASTIVSSANSGSANAAYFQAAAQGGTALFGATGSTYSGIAILQNRAFVDAGTGLNGLVLDTNTAQPIVFGINNSEIARFDTSGNLVLLNGLQGVTSSLTNTSTSSATAFFQAAGSATAPVVQVRGGVTPGTGGDLLDLQTWDGATATTVTQFDSTGALTITGSGFTSVLNSNAISFNRAGNSYINNSNAGGALRIGIGTISSGSAGLTIDSNNRLGIGKTNPGAALDVNGAITTNSSLTVTGLATVQSANGLTLGTTANAGGILFQDGTANNYKLTMTTPALAASYSLTNPTSGASGNQCLQSTSGSTSTVTVLQWGSCGSGGGSSLQAAYDASSSPATITTSSSSKGINIQAGTGDDSTALFEVQGTTGAVLTVDTVNSDLQIGSATADTNQVNLVLDSDSTFSESSCSTSADPVGSLYYNTTSNTIRACVGSSWEDLVSTSGLGIMLYGVVADTGNNPGDLDSMTGAGVNGPCKVSFATTTSIHIETCRAFSGGRKVIVASQTINLSSANGGAGVPASSYANVCLTGASGAPAILASASTDAAAPQPTFDPNNPVLCLATLLTTASANTLSKIYDVRTFTQTVKTFATINSATNIGFVVVQSSTAGLAVTTATAKTVGVFGIVAASTGSASTNTVNAIVATNGPAWVKATAATPGAAFMTTTTAGYGATNTAAVAAIMGTAVKGPDAACNATTNCQYSAFIEADRQ